MHESAAELEKWFRAVNVSGDGLMTFAEWDEALGYRCVCNSVVFDVDVHAWIATC